MPPHFNKDFPGAAAKGLARPRTALVVSLVLFCATAGTVLWFWEGSAQRKTKILPVLGVVPEFRLTDQDGLSATPALLRGHITVCQMIYSRCETICPLLLSRFAELDQNFRRSTRLQLLSLTTDPATDQPPVLARLRRRYEASSHWVFVTGEPSEVARLAAGVFGVAPDLQGERLRAAAVDIPMLILVDGEGQIRQKYHGLDEEVVPAVLDDVGTLLRVEQRSTK